MNPKQQESPRLAPQALSDDPNDFVQDTPGGQRRQQLVDLAELSADDLFHLAALRREEEQRREEQFGVLLDGPALGAFEGRDLRDWRSWSHPVRLEHLTAVAREMAESGWPVEVVARALLAHAAESGWDDLDRPEQAVRDGMRAGLRKAAA